MGRATRQEWAKRIERWQDSGLTAKEFAAEIDVPPTSLSYWKWKLRQDARAPGAGSAEDVITVLPKRRRQSVATPRFLELVERPTDLDVAAPMLEVVLCTGVVVRVPSQFDEATLRRVATLLGGP
jgi:transposase